MLDTIRAWLNGTRDYNVGVALFCSVSSNKVLANTLSRGYTMHNNGRLQEEMLKICAELKAAVVSANTPPPDAKLPESKKKTDAPTSTAAILETVEKILKAVTNANPELHQAVKEEADTNYKILMNKRGLLFSMLPAGSYEDANRQDLVESRKQLCLDVVQQYNDVSQQYDDADHVKLYGKMPETEIEQPAETYADITDAMVKQELDNARKNFNKIKNKPVTPDRVISLQLHEHKIKILSERWASLKHIQ